MAPKPITRKFFEEFLGELADESTKLLFHEQTKITRGGWYNMCVKGKKKWSREVTKHSIALDLEEGVFTWDDPKKIALSIKYSANVSTRRKAKPFQSAMSMLNFYINRAGRNLKPQRKKILEQAKTELRKMFGK